MKKMFTWIKAHLPSKRRLIQVYAALLFNANLKGFKTGNIYTGGVKNICTPGLNCYSCPAASGACPLGALQNSIASSGKTVPYYVFGIILLYGILFGRWICGFLCPFGLVQELLHKIPTPKIKKGKLTRALSFFKYVLLVLFVGIVPLAYAFRNFPLPAFCKYICPAGTLEGAMGLLSNSVNEGYLRMLGPLFTWKFLLMVSILVMCVFMFRFFCRFLCPLGALYGLFNKISFVGVKVDADSCTDCGICTTRCKMDVRRVGDAECIMCGECIPNCPTKAISFKGSQFFLAKNAIEDIPEDASKTEKRQAAARLEAYNKKVAKRNKTIKIVAGILMAAILCGALVYYNFIDGKPQDPDTDTPAGDVGDDGSTDDDIILGTNVGNRCPAFEIDIVGSTEKFKVANNSGKVTVLNFWFTTCGPCLGELPHFYEVAAENKDTVDLVAVHIEQSGVDVSSFIQNNSGHPEWNDGTMLIGWDTGKLCQAAFRIQVCPITVVIDKDGIITDKFEGAITKAELDAAIEKAMANN